MLSNKNTAVASTASVTDSAQANTATAVSVASMFATDDVQAVATSVLTDIESNRTIWEKGAYKASNQALYSLLADCLEFCGDLDGKKSKARNNALEAFHANRGYSYSKDSTLATKVVRAVFGNIHRSRINTYSLVVNTAKAAQVNPIDMATWIEDQGGVQEIKKAKSTSYIPRIQQIETGKAVFAARPELATISSPELDKMADKEKVGEECVLLATQNDDGSFTVKAVSYKEGLVKTAMTALCAEEKAAAVKLAKEQKAA